MRLTPSPCKTLVRKPQEMHAGQIEKRQTSKNKYLWVEKVELTTGKSRQQTMAWKGEGENQAVAPKWWWKCGTNLQVFQKNLLFPSPVRQMVATITSWTLLNLYQIMWSHVPEDSTTPCHLADFQIYSRPF